MKSLAGAQSSAGLAQDILLALHRRLGDTSQARGFLPPEGYRPVELCAQTGLRAADRCTEKLVEWFPAGHIPEEDDVFQTLRIDLRNGLLAAPWTPADYVAERTFAALAPEHAAWGAAHNLVPPPTDLSPLDRPQAVRPQKDSQVAGPARPEVSAATPHLGVAAPRDGLRMVRNPETPAQAMALNLRAVVSAGISQVVWLVDGKALCTTSPRAPVHWPLVAGVHRFEVTTPDGQTRSAPVTIEIE
jgi:penicillin-binding protein 1C